MTLLNESLMPGKFLACISQLLMTITILFTYEQNIRMNLSRNISTDDSDYETEEGIILLCVVLGILLQGIEIIILFMGKPLFYDKINVIEILIHGMGTILLSWYTYYDWSSSALWITWFFTSFIPFMLEVYILFSSHKIFKDK